MIIRSRTKTRTVCSLPRACARVRSIPASSHAPQASLAKAVIAESLFVFVGFACSLLLSLAHQLHRQLQLRVDAAEEIPGLRDRDVIGNRPAAFARVS
jgi:hypothetical protein